ncbi:NAD(P)-binding protein [Trichoderma chlorosporum]
MRAWTFSRGGLAEQVLSFKPSFSTPATPKGSDVLIRISHASLSSPGTNLMRDTPSFLRKNAIPELDFSGRIVLAGPDVPAEFAVGVAVFGTVSKLGSTVRNQGTLAEYIVLNVDCIAVKPTNITFEEAACLSCLGQVALAMVRQAKIKKGDRVLVNGGSGAIVDYSQVPSVPAALETSYSTSQFDAVLDAIGSQELFRRCPKYLKPEGLFINVGDGKDGRLLFILRTLQNVFQPTFLGGVPRRFVTFSAPLNGENAAHLGNLASKGKLLVSIDSTFSLEDVLSAYKRYQSGQAQGRVVIDIANMDTQDQ